ncbi:hypothetical protein GCM10009117_15790 [Gangjinia marincola]|uniref:Beta-lactamase-related domain-containing protein n=1 Tax=Gangjinia marincola TaxID=578463 RepID=A0ABN1MGX6_9FLAO
MTRFYRALTFVLLAFFFHQKLSSQNYQKLISEVLHQQSPGGTVLISIGDSILYHQSYGKADIELKVSMRNENIYRIASLSKQFTAIAILKLYEEKKLSLKDKITKYIPDYPTNGQSITVEHLLSHTSGIKDYVSTVLFDTNVMKQGKTTLELIDLFKNEPMDFEPGTNYSYSSSGYVLLGYIIEKVSGMSYEEYLKSTVFKPFHLNNTSYDKSQEIVQNRVSGYKGNDGDYKNAEFIDMSLPYSAGSLMSSAEDLFRWNKALKNHEIISGEILKQAYSPFILTSGKRGLHGFGWEIGYVQDVKAVKHSGRINGFISYALYVPEKDIYIVILTNSEDVQNADLTATKLAAMAMGKPYDWSEINLSMAELESLNGIYRNEYGVEKIIRLEDESLLFFDRGRTKNKLVPYAPNAFYVQNTLATFSVERKDGQIQFIENDTYQIKKWTRIDNDIKSIRSKKVRLKDLKKYVGKYEMEPAFYFNVLIENDKLIGQIKNDKKELLPIGKNKFIAKDIDALLTFNLENDKIVSLSLDQGRVIIAKKIK